MNGWMDSGFFDNGSAMEMLGIIDLRCFLENRYKWFVSEAPTCCGNPALLFPRALSVLPLKKAALLRLTRRLMGRDTAATC